MRSKDIGKEEAEETEDCKQGVSKASHVLEHCQAAHFARCLHLLIDNIFEGDMLGDFGGVVERVSVRLELRLRQGFRLRRTAVIASEDLGDFDGPANDANVGFRAPDLAFIEDDGQVCLCRNPRNLGDEDDRSTLQ